MARVDTNPYLSHNLIVTKKKRVRSTTVSSNTNKQNGECAETREGTGTRLINKDSKPGLRGRNNHLHKQAQQTT